MWSVRGNRARGRMDFPHTEMEQAAGAAGFAWGWRDGSRIQFLDKLHLIH